MSRIEDQAAIAAFIRKKGVTRCPTVCLAPTHATVDAEDRDALRRLAAARENRRRQRAFEDWRRTFGVG